MPQWLVLHYYLPQQLYIREETYPVPIVEAEAPLGIKIEAETGYRQVTVYELARLLPPKLNIVDEYDEIYTSVGAGLGLEISWSDNPDISLETGLNVSVFEGELAVGTDVIQGTVYIEQPGWIAFKKKGFGLDWQTGENRFLAVREDVVEKEGYRMYGTRRLGDDYEFGGVMLEANSKFALYARWHSLNCYSDVLPHDPECLRMKLEEIP